MKDESANPGGPAAGATRAPGLPAAVDRPTFHAELDRLRVRALIVSGEEYSSAPSAASAATA
jgi:hypothetical protein